MSECTKSPQDAYLETVKAINVPFLETFVLELIDTEPMLGTETYSRLQDG